MKYFGWIFLFFIMVYIVPLGSRPMLAPQEFYNAEISREMLINKSANIPVLLGEQDLSMPMNYWLTAGSFKLFGENAFANRLPSALAVGLTALLLALLIRQALRDEKLAALAAMIYMSSSLVFCIGTLALSNNVFTMFITGAFGLFFLASQEKKFNRRKFLLHALCGISVGAAFLTRGLIAFAISALIIVIYLLCSKKWLELFLAPLIIVIFAGLTILPWSIAVIRQMPDAGLIVWNDFMEHFINVENTRKFSGWYYYLPQLILGLLPAGLLIPAAGAEGKAAWKKLLSQPLFQFCFFALVILLIFFSAIPLKHSANILLCFPPTAILIAAGVQLYFNGGGHHRSYNWVMNIWGFLLAVCGITMIVLSFLKSPILSEFLKKLHFTENLLLLFGIASTIGGALILYSLRGNWRSRLYLFFFGIALLPLSFSWCIKPNGRMPEKIIASFIVQHDLNPQKTTIAASRVLAPGVAWICKNDQVRIISGKKCCEAVLLATDINAMIKNANRKSPLLIVAYAGDPIWKEIQSSAKVKTVNGISFMVLI